MARWKGPTERAEQIVEETPVVLVYNGIPHVVMMATPADLEDFIAGLQHHRGADRAPPRTSSDVKVVRYGQGIEVQSTVPPNARP